MKRTSILLVLILAGCTTAEQEDTRFRSFTGMTMAQFMAETLVTPTDQYESGGKRIFVAAKGACTFHLETKQNGRGSGPDGWTIVGTRRLGTCVYV